MFKEYIHIDEYDDQPPRPLTPPTPPPPPPAYHYIIGTARDAFALNAFASILEHIAEILNEIADYLRRL